MLKFYWKIVFRPYLFRIILITAATTISSLMEIASIGLVVPLITLVISPAEMNGSWTMTLINTVLLYVNIPPNSNAVIFFMVFAVSILVLAKNVFYITQAYWVSLLSTDISNLFRTRMFRSYLYASYAEIARRGRGSIYQDIDAASTNIFVIVRIASFLLYSAIYVVAMLALMMYLSWWGTLIVGGLALLSIRYMRSALEHHSRRIGAETHTLAQRRSTLLVDAIDGARVVKIHAREDVVVSHLDKFQAPLKSLNAQSALLANFPIAFFEISGALLVAILIGLVINFPDLGLTLPILAGMVLALRRLQPAASAVNNNLIELSRLLKQVEIADEVLNQLPSEISGSYKFSREEGPQTIVFQDVGFYYPQREGTPVLQNINLAMHRGKVTAFVGHTGAGKTTIADLLVRLYDPSSGYILVNGINLQDLDLHNWRRCVGYVGQDPYLFNDTLYNNIAMWDMSISRSQVERVAQSAQLHEFIMELSEGYDTVIGDRGLKLSGGQRQRVSIARAILHQPNILIFDEATSALDTITERDVNWAISNLRGNAIVVIIAHRLSTVRDADRIVVLDHGKIAEVGTHEDLINLNGIYCNLYQGDETLSIEPPT